MKLIFSNWMNKKIDTMNIFEKIIVLLILYFDIKKNKESKK